MPVPLFAPRLSLCCHATSPLTRGSIKNNEISSLGSDKMASLIHYGLAQYFRDNLEEKSQKCTAFVVANKKAVFVTNLRRTPQ